MAVKLKLTSKQIPWSLALRALCGALLWLLAPAWFFVVAAVALYLVPVFKPRSVAVPFAVFLIASANSEPSLVLSPLVGGALFLILGIKDLILVDRVLSYRSLMVILAFLLFVSSFGLGAPTAYGAFTASACLCALLLNEPVFAGATIDLRQALLSLGIALLAWQSFLIIPKLPVTPLSEVLLAFFFFITLSELVKDHRARTLDRVRLLFHGGVWGALTLLVLALNPWVL